MLIRVMALILGLVSFSQSWALPFPIQPQPTVKYRFPIADQDRHLISRLFIGMDHDNKHGWNLMRCRSSRGKRFPACYNDHRGTDYMLKGSFRTMDRGSAEIVAAADGIVVGAIDTRYDRCRFRLFRMNVWCKGLPKKANYVTVKHADGFYTRYLHLKKNSLTVKVGDQVKCGEKLALIGSSGISSKPHLHFMVYDTQGNIRDPYAGKNSQAYSFWTESIMKDKLPSGECFKKP